MIAFGEFMIQACTCASLVCLCAVLISIGVYGTLACIKGICELVKDWMKEG